MNETSNTLLSKDELIGTLGAAIMRHAHLAQQWTPYQWTRPVHSTYHTDKGAMHCAQCATRATVKWVAMDYQPYMRPLYAEIATLIDAYKRCVATGNDFASKHLERLESIERNYLPSGSGIDSGCKIDIDASTPDKVVLTFGYHYMNDGGYYDGWYDYRVTVKPSLISGIDVKIVGSNRGEVKDYLYQVFECLREEVDVKTL